MNIFIKVAAGLVMYYVGRIIGDHENWQGWTWQGSLFVIGGWIVFSLLIEWYVAAEAKRKLTPSKKQSFRR